MKRRPNSALVDYAGRTPFLFWGINGFRGMLLFFLVYNSTRGGSCQWEQRLVVLPPSPPGPGRNLGKKRLVAAQQGGCG
jgi:hypothetical protein